MYPKGKDIAARMKRFLATECQNMDTQITKTAMRTGIQWDWRGNVDKSKGATRAYTYKNTDAANSLSRTHRGLSKDRAKRMNMKNRDLGKDAATPISWKADRRGYPKARTPRNKSLRQRHNDTYEKCEMQACRKYQHADICKEPARIQVRKRGDRASVRCTDTNINAKTQA